jgi:release factor glutamine methyltransferase
VEFYGLKLKVTTDVLIPRPETEILVDKIAKSLTDVKGKRLLDLCTGSGCIGLALKKKFPSLQGSLSDLSSKALDVAKENSKINDVQVEFFQGDLFEPLALQKFDYIICNPPYISESEYADLSKEVRDFEPKEALLAGPSGLEFYQRLSRELPSHLNPGGKVWLEIGASQGASVSALFLDRIWKSCILEKDWSGHDRFISLELQ